MAHHLIQPPTGLVPGCLGITPYIVLTLSYYYVYLYLYPWFYRRTLRIQHVSKVEPGLSSIHSPGTLLVTSYLNVDFIVDTDNSTCSSDRIPVYAYNGLLLQPHPRPLPPSSLSLSLSHSADPGVRQRGGRKGGRCASNLRPTVYEQSYGVCIVHTSYNVGIACTEVREYEYGYVLGCLLRQ